MKRIAHLTGTTSFGGPERQMLELARVLKSEYETLFCSYACQAFLDEVRRAGFRGLSLKHDTPWFWTMGRELVSLLKSARVDLLCCHGYKASLLGLPAARCCGIPVMSVSRGWTAETFRVRVYESLERFILPWMDRVISVSHGQAAKVVRAGVPQRKQQVVWNAIRGERFVNPDPQYRSRLERLFPRPPTRIVGAAGRLSPEKGFGVLIEAVGQVLGACPDAGCVVFGEGRLRKELEQQVREKGLCDRIIFPGFATDLDQYVPHFDVLALPSFTEGLPNVILEAFASGVPVVATRVGGNPELVEDGVSGYLVAAGDATALAERISAVLFSRARREMGLRGRDRVLQDFSFAAQARAYGRIFETLLSAHGRKTR